MDEGRDGGQHARPAQRQQLCVALRVLWSKDGTKGKVTTEREIVTTVHPIERYAL